MRAQLSAPGRSPLPTTDAESVRRATVSETSVTVTDRPRIGFRQRARTGVNSRRIRVRSLVGPIILGGGYRTGYRSTPLWYMSKFPNEKRHFAKNLHTKIPNGKVDPARNYAPSERTHPGSGCRSAAGQRWLRPAGSRTGRRTLVSGYPDPGWTGCGLGVGQVQLVK